jgi:septal ring factor EnvC (AmiA/AmiB activator)
MRCPSWLRWPCVSREWASTLQARIERREKERDAALNQVAELKQRVLDTEARHDEAEGKRRQLARWLADEKTSNRRLTEELAAVSIVNTRLTEDLTEVRAQLTDSAAAHWSAQARREKKRADRLQKQYDDAVGLKPGGIEDSRKWQPGYKDPKADAS